LQLLGYVLVLEIELGGFQHLMELQGGAYHAVELQDEGRNLLHLLAQLEQLAYVQGDHVEFLDDLVLLLADFTVGILHQDLDQLLQLLS